MAKDKIERIDETREVESEFAQALDEDNGGEKKIPQGQPGPIPPLAKPAIQEEPKVGIEYDPYDFDKCVISVQLVYLPREEGKERQVMVGVRSHLDAPLIEVYNEPDLVNLNEIIRRLLERIKNEIPRRGLVKKEAEAARKKQDEDAAKRRDAAIKGRDTVKANIAAKTGTPVTAASPTPKGKTPDASQMSMFDLFS